MGAQLRARANTRYQLIAISDLTFPPLHSRKTVSKLFVLGPLGFALSEKQIPQIVETIRSVEN